MILEENTCKINIQNITIVWWVRDGLLKQSICVKHVSQVEHLKPWMYLYYDEIKSFSDFFKHMRDI